MNHPEDTEKIGRLRELMFEQVGSEEQTRVKMRGKNIVLPRKLIGFFFPQAGSHSGVRPRRAREVRPPGHETSPQEAGGPVSSDEDQSGHPGWGSLSPNLLLRVVLRGVSVRGA